MSSDCCNRPTLTFPNGAYNASQVRLYGIHGSPGVTFPGNSKFLGSKEVNFSTNISSGTEEDDKKINEQLTGMINEIKNDGKTTEEDIFEELVRRNPPGIPPIPLPVGYTTQISIDARKVGTVVLSTLQLLRDTYNKNKYLSSGIIFGYSYEGHCYDLPKPKIMILTSMPQDIPVDDCGYDKKISSNPNIPTNYKLWIVDKLDECVELEMNQGFVEQIVLEANLPGKRSPSMYASRMMMGHRTGKLGEP